MTTRAGNRAKDRTVTGTVTSGHCHFMRISFLRTFFAKDRQALSE